MSLYLLSSFRTSVSSENKSQDNYLTTLFDETPREMLTNYQKLTRCQP